MSDACISLALSLSLSLYVYIYIYHMSYIICNMYCIVSCIMYHLSCIIYNISYIIYHISYIMCIIYIYIYILYHVLYHISIYQSIYQSANLSIYQSKHLPLMAAGCWVNCGLPEPVWLRGRIGHENPALFRFTRLFMLAATSFQTVSSPTETYCTWKTDRNVASILPPFRVL